MKNLCTGLLAVLLMISLLIISCGNNNSNNKSDSTPPPEAPSNVTATGNKFITVNWDALPDTSYNLYWNTTGNVTTSDNVINNVSPPYEQKDLIYNGTTYYYAVTAVKDPVAGQSQLSTEASATSTFPIHELFRVTGSDSQTLDRYGQSVSISGDYAIVGSPYNDGAGTLRGAAYIYYRNLGGTDNWGEVKKLTPSDTADHDIFGFSVSISGDYAVVGSPDKRAAYVYFRNQGGADNWGEFIKLTASDTEAGDSFGQTVSISGDYAVVGAPFKGRLTQRGAAYIYYRNQGGTDHWGELTKLAISDAADVDNFGTAVSINGDRAIVTASSKSYAGFDSGVAYVFYQNQEGVDNWGEVAELAPSGAEDFEQFGYSVSINGDYAIVGTPYENGAGTYQGAAYVYYRNQGGTDKWGEVIRLIGNDTADYDGFGNSVSISGDYVLVGAPSQSSLGRRTGAAYLYYRNQGGTDTWGEVTKLSVLVPTNFEHFGWSACIDSDYAIVGANNESTTGTAYIF